MILVIGGFGFFDRIPCCSGKDFVFGFLHSIHKLIYCCNPSETLFEPGPSFVFIVQLFFEFTRISFHTFSPFCKCAVTNMWSRWLVGLLWIISSVSVVRISSGIMRCVEKTINATLILHFTMCSGCLFVQFYVSTCFSMVLIMLKSKSGCCFIFYQH